MSQADTGRVQQKLRTRKALLGAARELLDRGLQPSLQEVADHATISRATTYRYFSSSEALLQEAVLDGISAELDGRGMRPEDGGSLEARAEATVDRILAMVLDNEMLFRTYLRSVVSGDGRPARGGRRIGWLTDAYGTEAETLPKRLVQRMTAALALLSGIEAVIVARDVCGLDAAEARELCRWTARAIVRAALEEAGRG